MNSSTVLRMSPSLSWRYVHLILTLFVFFAFFAFGLYIPDIRIEPFLRCSIRICFFFLEYFILPQDPSCLRPIRAQRITYWYREVFPSSHVDCSRLQSTACPTKSSRYPPFAFVRP